MTPGTWSSSRVRDRRRRHPGLIAAPDSGASGRRVSAARAQGASPTRAEWEALGTSAVLAVSDARALREGRAIVERELGRIDWACSRFRPDSELSRVNAHAGRPVQVDPLLMEALEVGMRAARLTDGDVDPTVGRALELGGYDRDWALLEPAPDPVWEGGPLRSVGVGRPVTRLLARVRPAWERVELDRTRNAVRLPPGAKLDLGATGKAWAADRASRAVHAATGAGVLVSLGGDISTHGDPPEGGWAIHVTDDHRAGASAPGQRIVIHGGGLATSSVAVRRWGHRGETMHHIIDPSTGVPARGLWRTVSVAAMDCTDANIVSTAALVRGGAAADWVRSLGVPSRLVSHDGEVLTLGGWPVDDPSPSQGPGATCLQRQAG